VPGVEAVRHHDGVEDVDVRRQFAVQRSTSVSGGRLVATSRWATCASA
jgi:hypothetical protein